MRVAGLVVGIIGSIVVILAAGYAIVAGYILEDFGYSDANRYLTMGIIGVIGGILGIIGGSLAIGQPLAASILLGVASLLTIIITATVLKEESLLLLPGILGLVMLLLSTALAIFGVFEKARKAS